MSVVGIGTDIIEIARLEKMSAKTLDKLAQRVLVELEYKTFQNHNFPITYLAKRWAAKEAAVKALGTGIAAGISFQQVEIESLPSGQPQLIFTGEALLTAQRIGAKTFHVSLSDEKAYATAFVVLSS